MGDVGQEVALGDEGNKGWPAPPVSMYESGLERPVIIEDGNSDAWLECDVTVPVER